jgi:hypothetical protein
LEYKEKKLTKAQLTISWLLLRCPHIGRGEAKMQRKAIFPFYKLRTKDLVKDVYGKEDFQAIIKREKARANRTENWFSFVVFITNHNAEHLAVQKLAEQIRRRARIIDSVGWFDDHRIGIILPNTKMDGAKKFSGEISKLCQSDLIKSQEIHIYPSAWLESYQRNYKHGLKN